MTHPLYPACTATTMRPRAHWGLRAQCAVDLDRNLKPKLAVMRQCTSVTDRRTDGQTDGLRHRSISARCIFYISRWKASGIATLLMPWFHVQCAAIHVIAVFPTRSKACSYCSVLHAKIARNKLHVKPRHNLTALMSWTNYWVNWLATQITNQ